MPIGTHNTVRLFGLHSTEQRLLYDPALKYDEGYAPARRVSGSLLTAHWQYASSARASHSFVSDLRVSTILARLHPHAGRGVRRLHQRPRPHPGRGHRPGPRHRRGARGHSRVQRAGPRREHALGRAGVLHRRRRPGRSGLESLQRVARAARSQRGRPRRRCLPRCRGGPPAGADLPAGARLPAGPAGRHARDRRGFPRR